MPEKSVDSLSVPVYFFAWIVFSYLRDVIRRLDMCHSQQRKRINTPADKQ